VIGDHTLLSQVFTNLLENAFTYHNPDVPPQVSVTYHSEDNYVVVEVKDNGIGIPLEYHDKIFNMFQRLHSEDEYPGTGIGLATVRKSVALLGGSVWVESKVGEGSTFFVRLPKE
jgi:signal transduction histidine kinase